LLALLIMPPAVRFALNLVIQGKKNKPGSKASIKIKD